MSNPFDLTDIIFHFISLLQIKDIWLVSRINSSFNRLSDNEIEYRDHKSIFNDLNIDTNSYIYRGQYLSLYNFNKIDKFNSFIYKLNDNTVVFPEEGGYKNCYSSNQDIYEDYDYYCKIINPTSIENWITFAYPTEYYCSQILNIDQLLKKEKDYCNHCSFSCPKLYPEGFFVITCLCKHSIQMLNDLGQYLVNIGVTTSSNFTLDDTPHSVLLSFKIDDKLRLLTNRNYNIISDYGGEPPNEYLRLNIMINVSTKKFRFKIANHSLFDNDSLIVRTSLDLKDFLSVYKQINAVQKTKPSPEIIIKSYNSCIDSDLEYILDTSLK